MCAALPSLTYFVSGLVNDDMADAVLSGALKTVASSSSNVGTDKITQGTLVSNADYAISYIQGMLTITPANLVVTADSATKIYGRPNPSFSVTYNGFVMGQGPDVLGRGADLQHRRQRPPAMSDPEAIRSRREG